LLDRAAPLGPPTRIAHRRRARYLTALGDAPGARAEETRADEVTPALALDWFLLGYDALLARRNAEARACFQRALALEPDHFWARLLTAVTSSQKPGRPREALAEALADLTVCGRDQPELVWVPVLRGALHVELGALDSADADYQAAFRL